LEAQTTVHLGRLERNLTKGDLVEFDGYTLKFSGKETPMPELKAGIKRGWLKLSDGTASAPVEKEITAPAPAKKVMKIETVYDEERAVAEVSKTSSKTSSKNDVTISDKIEPTTKKFPLVVESQDDDMIAVSKVETKSGATINSASSAETSDGGLAESQGAESVGKIKIKTASKQKTVISDGSQASSEISRLENLQREALASEKPVKEPSAEEDIELSDLLDDDVEEFVVEEEASEPEISLADEQEKEAQQILSAVEGEVQPTQGAVTVGEDNSKVKSLPVGIDWDMSPHWRKRASLALELYKGHPEILEAIMEVESDGVVKVIKKGVGA
jgi:hypothetical protein